MSTDFNRLDDRFKGILRIEERYERGFFSKGMWKRSPQRGDSGGWKMECQKALVDDPMENEVVLEEEEPEDAFDKNNLPWDFEDQLYEAWRDEKRSTEASEE